MALAVFSAPAIATTTGSLTVSGSIDISSSNPYVAFVTNFDSATDDMVSITVGGVSATQLAKIQAPSPSNQYVYLYGLLAPTPGTAVSILATRTSISGMFRLYMASFSGANQSTQPDVSAVTNTGTSTTMTISVTPVTNGSIIYGGGRGGDNPSAGTGVTAQSNSGNATIAGYSTSPISPASSFALSFTTLSGAFGICAIAVRPAPSTNGSFLMFM